MSLAVGNKVTWASQAGGSTRVKEGTIVAIVGPFTDPAYDAQFIEIRKGHRSKLGLGKVRRDISYLVSVPGMGKGKPQLYWPRKVTLIVGA